MLYEVKVTLRFNTESDALAAADWIYTSSVDGLISIDTPQINKVADRKPTSFTEAVKLFKKAQDQYLDFGAGDTEPDTEFQIVLRNVYHYTDPMIPTSADQWQLFSDKSGSSKAADALSAATQVVVEAASRFPGEFGEWVRAGNLWRV